MYGCFACVSICATCAWCPLRLGAWFPGTGVTDICKPPYGAGNWTESSGRAASTPNSRAIASTLWYLFICLLACLLALLSLVEYVHLFCSLQEGTEPILYPTLGFCLLFLRWWPRCRISYHILSEGAKDLYESSLNNHAHRKQALWSVFCRWLRAQRQTSIVTLGPGDPNSHPQDWAADGAHAHLQERNGWSPV